MNDALVIIANPAAGSGGTPLVIEQLRERAPHARIVMSEGAQGVRATVAALELNEGDTLAVLGGDGTVHQAVSGLFESARTSMPTLAVVPCGSGNALAQALGIHKTADALQALSTGSVRAIDVAHLQHDAGACHAINVIGWGLPARVTQRADAVRGTGAMPYTVTAIRELLGGDVAPIMVTSDGSGNSAEVIGMACLTPHAGGGMPFAPDASLDDGALNLVQVAPMGRLRLLTLFARLLFGRHLSARGVSHALKDELLIEFGSAEPVVVDGEMIETRQLSIEMLPRALRVLAPR